MLGSRKLLIFLCIVPCVLSLVCIGAFAAPAEDFIPSYDLPLDTEVVEDFVKSPSAVAEETFPAEPLLESSYYSYNSSFSSIGTGPATALSHVLQFTVYDGDGTYVCGVSLPEGASVWRGGIVSNPLGFSDCVVAWGDSDSDSIRFTLSTPYSARFVFISSDTTQSINSSTVSGTLVEEDLIPELADSVFDLGDALISFVMSSWVVMIPLAAWLVVLCIGAIRKLVKGV